MAVETTIATRRASRSRRPPVPTPRPGRAARTGRLFDRLAKWDARVRTRWPFAALVGPDISPAAVDGDG